MHIGLSSREFFERFLSDQKDKDQDEAAADLAKSKALIELLKYPHFAVSIECHDLKLYLCRHELLIPAIQAHIAEIEKFQSGKPNEWE